ncbi:hypothetical protein D9757_000187 [Collybiopsis confluens]|uniref:Uncharacterized protein n=1 Tax=Collybiopsis confluens TaxID=2823264 RepID=A0A8H5I2A0_9AGAR|nr:hypothetical protein D9757_000187 [Collybiopsis confluens]
MSGTKKRSVGLRLLPWAWFPRCMLVRVYSQPPTSTSSPPSAYHMTTLPSFVELMASLGINATSEHSEDQTVPSSSSSSPSPSPSPKSPGLSPTSLRSKSSPSLRDQASRPRLARYSPYSSTFISARRRGSVSSVSSSSSSSDTDGVSERSSSCSPTLCAPSPRHRKRRHNKLIVNIYGSSTDLSANTPISTYVRRKTPGTSPSSPSFPRELREFSKPFIIPSLPAFLPNTVALDSPMESELDASSSEPTSSAANHNHTLKPFPDIDLDILSRRSQLRTGIRISTSPYTPPRFTGAGEHHRMVHVA